MIITFSGLKHKKSYESMQCGMGSWEMKVKQKRWRVEARLYTYGDDGVLRKWDPQLTRLFDIKPH